MAEEPRELKYPQLAEAQIDIWLDNPVTRALIKCFEWKRLDARDSAGSGELVDSSSTDLTSNLLHRNLGQQDAYREAATPRDILEFYDLVLIPKEDDAGSE